MTRLLATASVAALLALPAMAQMNDSTKPAPEMNKPSAAQSQTSPRQVQPAANPSQANPGAGAAPSSTAAKELDPADAQFVKTAAADGTAEVELGKLAATKAENASVKKFGQQMADDHTKAGDKLMSLVKSKGDMAPPQPTAEQQSMKQKLSGLSGPQFDRTYMQAMVKDHQKAVQLFQRQANQGKDAELKSFAADTLPTLQEHLKMAQQVAAEVTKTASMPSDQSEQPAAKTPRNKAAGAGASGDRMATRGTARTPVAQDPEHARIVELNRQQLQRIEQGGGALPPSGATR